MKNMIRRQFFIPADQIAFLRAQSKATDRTKAYIVREAIRFYASQKFDTKLAPEPELNNSDR
jgi:predicted DNA-binding protein